MDLTTLQVCQLFVLGLFAGGTGALTGIGGGIIITPILTLYLGVPIHNAIGTSLCCVIATSSGSAASYVERRLSDVRLGMTLELATTTGALAGAFVAGWISREALAVLFAVLLVYGSGMVIRRTFGRPVGDEDVVAAYSVKRLPLGLAGSSVAGMISGLLGVGGGPIKVPMMYLLMGVPFKVATATSNFMIGVTAATSAFIYYSRGDIRLRLTAATAVGVFAGASLATRLLRRTPTRLLQLLFSAILLALAAMMAWKALHHGFAS